MEHPAAAEPGPVTAPPPEPGSPPASTPTRDPRWRLAAWVVVALAAIAAVAPLVPQLRSGAFIDLGVYRMGGRALLDRVPLYDTAYEVSGLPFTYTPFAAVVFAPFALLSHPVAAGAWTVVSVAALVRSCALIVREGRDRLPDWASPALATAALTTVALALEPVRNNLDFGQVNLVIMWLVLEDLLARRDRRLGGALVGIATGIKIIPAVYLALLAVTGRLRQAVVGGVVAALTVGVGFALTPSEAWRYWSGLAYDSSRVGNVAYVSNQSINGALARLVRPDGSRMLALALAAVVMVAALLLARRLWLRSRRLPAIAVVTLAGLLASPISWSHHWVWIVVVLGALATDPVGPGWARWSLFAATVALTSSRVIWGVTDVQGWADWPNAWEPIAANAYVLGALVLLGWFAWTATRPDDGSDAASGVGSAVEVGHSPM